jgi:hypothetical protein
MVTKRTIKVPIYDYRVIIVVTDTWEEASKVCPSLDYGSKACVIEQENGTSTIVIPSNQPATVVHECVHLKDCIWNYIGQIPKADNDEVDAYLVEYLFTEVSKVIDKHNLKHY